MALFQPGPLTGAISGTLGAVEFQSSSKCPKIRMRRARRPAQSKLALEHSRILALFAALWRDGSQDVRDAWKIYADQSTMTNRFGKQVPCKAYTAALKHHIFIIQYLNMVFPDPAALQPPPPKTLPAPYITSLSLSFDTTPAYTVTSTLSNADSVRELLWAGPSRGAPFTTLTNWRFIGSQEKTGDAMDWTSFFTGARCNWTFALNDHVWIMIAHARTGGVTFPNTQWYRHTQVVAP